MVKIFWIYLKSLWKDLHIWKIQMEIKCQTTWHSTHQRQSLGRVEMYCLCFNIWNLSVDFPTKITLPLRGSCLSYVVIVSSLVKYFQWSWFCWTIWTRGRGLCCPTLRCSASCSCSCRPLGSSCCWLCCSWQSSQQHESWNDFWQVRWWSWWHHEVMIPWDIIFSFRPSLETWDNQI